MGSRGADEIRRTFPARSSELAGMRRFVFRLATGAGLEQRAHWLALAVTEACTNAIVHTGSEAIEITWRSLPDRVEVDVADQGVFRSRIEAPEIDGEGHRGIPIMMAATDEVHVRQGTPERPGTMVRLILRRDRAARGSRSAILRPPTT